MFVSAPAGRAHHLVQEDLRDCAPRRLVVTEVPGVLNLIERRMKIESGRQSDRENAIFLNKPALSFLGQVQVQHVGGQEAEGKVMDC